jgi:hypothetical protein
MTSYTWLKVGTLPAGTGAPGVGVGVGVGVGLGVGDGVDPGLALAPGPDGSFWLADGPGNPALETMASVVVASSAPEEVLAEIRPLPVTAFFGTVSGRLNEPAPEALKASTTPPL